MMKVYANGGGGSNAAERAMRQNMTNAGVTSPTVQGLAVRRARNQGSTIQAANGRRYTFGRGGVQ